MIDGYTIQRALRASDAAPVYLALAPDGAQVVVKKMSIGADPQTAARMRARFDLIASIDHPGIPAYHELRIDGESATWIHEFVPGDTVRVWIDEHRHFTEAEVFEFLASMLELLAVIHDHGLIHRDLKPENIVAKPDGTLALIDFAGANVWDEAGNVSVLGTTGYAAPEQLVGDAVFASDQYGLAATALHLATGRNPTEFPLRNLRIELENAGLSRGLEDTLEKMLEPDPTMRFGDTTAALEAVRRMGAKPAWEWALQEIEPLAKTVVEHESGPGYLEIRIKPRVHRRAMFVSVTCLVFFIALLFWFYLPSLAILFSPFIAGFGWLVWRELRRLRTTKIRIEDDATWSLEESRPFRRLRITGEGRLTTVPLVDQGFVQHSDQRQALYLQSSNRDWVVAWQLYSVEALAIARAVSTYQDGLRPLLTSEADLDHGALVPQRPVHEAFIDARPDIVRAAFGLHLRHRVLSDAQTAELDEKLSPRFRERVEAAGFRKLTGMREGVFFGLLGLKFVNYVTADGQVRLAARPSGESSSAAGVSYFLTTTLEDRRQIITWSNGLGQMRTTKQLVSLPTSGSLDADLRTHIAVVEEERRRGVSALVLRDPQDAVATTGMFYRFASPMSAVALMFTPLLLIVMILLALLL